MTAGIRHTEFGTLLHHHHALSHVFLERARYRKRHLAEATLVSVLTVSTVSLHVPRQLRTLSTGVGTKLALVRFFTRVRSSMDRKIRAILKYLAAILASIVPTATFFL